VKKLIERERKRDECRIATDRPPFLLPLYRKESFVGDILILTWRAHLLLELGTLDMSLSLFYKRESAWKWAQHPIEDIGAFF
jgi:hypothetical protein